MVCVAGSAQENEPIFPRWNSGLSVENPSPRETMSTLEDRLSEFDRRLPSRLARSANCKKGLDPTFRTPSRCPRRAPSRDVLGPFTNSGWESHVRMPNHTEELVLQLSAAPATSPLVSGHLPVKRRAVMAVLQVETNLQTARYYCTEMEIHRRRSRGCSAQSAGPNAWPRFDPESRRPPSTASALSTC